MTKLFLKYFLFGFMLMSLSDAYNQTNNIYINFQANFYKKNLEKDAVYFINNNDSLKITQLKFYISNINLKRKSANVYTEKNSYHLVDVFEKKTTSIILQSKNKIEFDEIEFSLGIDSLTNSKGVQNKDLDPLKGMYWAWHSGYINLKLEGKSNLCATRNNMFQFHLGGFLNNFYNMQILSLKTKPTKNILINVELNNFFSGVDLKNLNHIMTPSTDAVELSKEATKMFFIPNYKSLQN